jgi:general secretion pathway protein G
MKFLEQNKDWKQAGFTLIEMMIVVAIIALIGSLVGVQVIKRFDQARVDTTKNQIRSLSQVLDDFRRVCGRYPTTEQGLDALVKKENAPDCKNWDEFIKRLPQDAWNHDFSFTSDGNKTEIKSLGADGKEGGNGPDADISSNDL